MSIRLSNFDYILPGRLIAQHPAQQRGASRLMRLQRDSGQVSHHSFNDLPSLLQPGDLLVVNDTKVIPAKFFCRRAGGGRIEGLYLQTDQAGCWEVLLKNARRCKPAERLDFVVETETVGALAEPVTTPVAPAGPGLELLENLGGGRWLARPTPYGSADEILQRVGRPPLPPYIKREEHDTRTPEDRDRYQNVYASQPGAVAAPTAGLHFTDSLFAKLSAQRDIKIVRVTLHVGLGTFEPVKSDDLSRHEMHIERYELSAEAAGAIAEAKSAGRRIVAVGTTSVRVVESVAAANGGRIVASRGETNLFLYPPSDFHIVEALITNFHLPKSTLLMLVASFCDPGSVGGTAKILNAYAQAIRDEYRFFSYGDAMLIE